MMGTMGKLAAMLLLAILALACRREIPQGPFPAMSMPQTALEERETVVILDGVTAGKIAVEKQAMRHDNQGRLEVFANIRNLTAFPQSIDVQTVFKNADMISTGDETAWTRLSLGPNETKTYQTVSIDDKPEHYTIRIRMGQ